MVNEESKKKIENAIVPGSAHILAPRLSIDSIPSLGLKRVPPGERWWEVTRGENKGIRKIWLPERLISPGDVVSPRGFWRSDENQWREVNLPGDQRQVLYAKVNRDDVHDWPDLGIRGRELAFKIDDVYELDRFNRTRKSKTVR